MVNSYGHVGTVSSSPYHTLGKLRVYSRQGDWGIPPFFLKDPPPNFKKEGGYFYMD